MRPQRVPQLQGCPLRDVVPDYDNPLQVRHCLVMVQEFEQNVSAVVGLDDDGKPPLLLRAATAVALRRGLPLGGCPAQRSQDAGAPLVLSWGQQSCQGCTDQQ